MFRVYFNNVILFISIAAACNAWAADTEEFNIDTYLLRREYARNDLQKVLIWLHNKPYEYLLNLSTLGSIDPKKKPNYIQITSE